MLNNAADSAKHVWHSPPEGHEASINGMQLTALRAAADAGRVCQAWHRASRVEIPMPGIGGAEG